jgi:methyl-accepting chemotaxis protein
MKDIQKMSSVNHEVSDIVSAIATAIEEQSSVTRDIASNLARASSGVREANERVGQTSEVTLSIAKEILGVDQSATEMTSGIEKVQASAEDLSRLAENLKRTIDSFRV